MGTDTITATYSGDNNHSGSSGTLSGGQMVNGTITPTTIAVTSVNPASEAYGQDAQITITAVLSWTGNGPAPTASAITISGNGPSGTYGTTSCGAPSGDTITCTNTYTPTAADTVGSYTESATFAGDSNYSGSSSTETNNFTITQATTSTGVTSNVNPSVFGQAVMLTATINGEYGLVKGRNGAALGRGLAQKRGAHPLDVSGTVTWSANTGCGTTPVTTGNPGVATCITSSLAVGTDTITATYSGDSEHGGSSGTLNGGQVVDQASTSTSLTSSLNPSELGQKVTFTATVAAQAPGSGTPAGTVEFFDGANLLGSGTLSAGQAKFATSALTAGMHSITAQYGGSTDYSGSTSPILVQTVQAGQLTVTPTSLNFGNVYIGYQLKKVVKVENFTINTVLIGPVTLTVTQGDASQFQLEHVCQPKLYAGRSCTISVLFTPDAVGTDTATLNIPNSAGSPIEVPITAAGRQKK